MKKLMIIAVIISGMLMPAQVFAKNDRRGDNKVQMDYNRAKKKNNKGDNHNLPKTEIENKRSYHSFIDLNVH